MTPYDQRPDFGLKHDSLHIAGFFGEYRWLSNFHLCRVVYDGAEYPSSENAYQAAKFSIDDRCEFQRVTPAAAKKLAAKLLKEDTHGVDPELWDQRKLGVMRETLRSKFFDNPELASKLVATGARLLEETNWWGDRYWGVYRWTGNNYLGQLLMELRDELRKTP